MVQEVMLSGFELKLYSPNELAFAYWYTLGPVKTNQEIIDALNYAVKDGSNEMGYLRYQATFLEALSKMLNAFARLSCRQSSILRPSENRVTLNFQRRFKWAFGKKYDALQSHDPATPDYDGFILWREGVLSEEDWTAEVKRQLTDAHRLVLSLEDMEALPHHLSLCAEEHDKLLSHLREVCQGYLSTLDTWDHTRVVKFAWPAEVISWFPKLS